MSRFSNRDRLRFRFTRIRVQTRQEVARAVRQGALLVEGDAAASIQDQTPGGNPYPSRGRRGAVHFAAPAGSAPNADTGELHTSITSAFRETSRSIEATTGANTPYATPLELGSGEHGPWPFMGPAFRRNIRRMTLLIRRAAQRGARR